ncbi:MAG: threonine/serine exporter family protein [Lachnospiraceae bacterium]|nr:threonine/serine exporter family protein [Lachnospiraceae bacterium]
MKNDLEYLLDFSLKLGEKMIVSGANLERVTDTIYRVCDSYGCQDIHFFSLSCYLSLNIKDADGNRVSGQRCIRRGMNIRLDHLGQLNQLSRLVCSQTPSPEQLDRMLEDAVSAKGYSMPMLLFGSLLSSACLTGIFDGSSHDLMIVLLNMILLFFSGTYLRKLVLNKTVYNVLSAFLVGTIAILFDKIGFLDDFYTVMIVNSMKLIPGIPMVNAFRNLLTGNEINGALELFKVILESIAIACGFLMSIFLFYGGLS